MFTRSAVTISASFRAELNQKTSMSEGSVSAGSITACPVRGGPDVLRHFGGATTSQPCLPVFRDSLRSTEESSYEIGGLLLHGM
jgi:hypothetical protein